MATSLDRIVSGLDEFTFNEDTTKVSSTSRTPGGDLGKDEFLQLLVCQLKNQDPLEPDKDTDFIAQLAQFSALEQMQNLNETALNSQAFSLVGKSVVINTAEDGEPVKEVSGVVDYITMKNGSAQLSVDGQLYPIEDLIEVKDSYYAIQEYLPSVEKTQVTYDKSNKKPVEINIDLGDGSYAASSVAVVINGDYVKSDYLTYEDGVLSIWPGAFEELGVGEYPVGLYFDDPYSTSITDKVTIKIVDSGIQNGEETDGDGENTDSGESDTGSVENADA